MVERCGYQWPADCPRVERRADETWQAACCARPVADGAGRCRLTFRDTDLWSARRDLRSTLLIVSLGYILGNRERF